MQCHTIFLSNLAFMYRGRRVVADLRRPGTHVKASVSQMEKIDGEQFLNSFHNISLLISNCF